ncbi:RING finger protein, putative [Pediculus humanus corporis]|uniref:RING finger protein, putative n=1 Tax=Pediculus humanus subsp. corporis TaxID=121224 RepID=E0VTT6_PEDHC|nr:RING finger protein, putative [Pediculus humanus corporis]EEB16792.1 RING finger protein, putative [Pediculus humanus corporis]
MRQEDTKFCCKKCQILTARPLDRNELLNLRSRDLINYLTSRHISTSGCVEKEDLVNILIRDVNDSYIHPSTSTPLEGNYCTNSYPNTPRNSSFNTSNSNEKKRFSFSAENLFNEDGIRIIGHDDSNNRELNHESNVSEQNIPNSEINEPVENRDSCGSPSNTNKPLMLSDIKDSNDLNALSIKQLKELLMRNRTDFKGCIERTELLQKANRLWSDYVVSRKDLDNLSLDELCKICMDAPIECVLLECGHMATCTSCGKQLCECPICRQFVIRCVRTFKA